MWILYSRLELVYETLIHINTKRNARTLTIYISHSRTKKLENSKKFSWYGHEDTAVSVVSHSDHAEIKLSFSH